MKYYFNPDTVGQSRKPQISFGDEPNRDKKGRFAPKARTEYVEIALTENQSDNPKLGTIRPDRKPQITLNESNRQAGQKGRWFR